jgi:hypothetical protein
MPTAHDQQQLDDELDLADAPARQLDVVAALGPPGGAALRFFADARMQLAQAVEDAVVEVAPIDERRDQRAQRQRAAARHRGARCHDAALQPREALPFAALDLEVLLQHGQADDRRPGIAVRAQREVDAEDETVVGAVADQRVQPARHLAKYSCADTGAAPSVWPSSS